MEKTSRIRRYPKLIERKYQADLVRTISELFKIVKRDLFPKLKNFRNSALNQFSKFDDIDEDLKIVFGDLKINFADRYPESLLESLAERRGIEVSENNLNLLASQVRQIKGIDLFLTSRGIKTQINMFIRQNVSLIETVHQSYFKDIQTIVFQGVGKGESTQLITERIMKKTGNSKTRARLIARDQISKLNGNITAQRHTSLGIKKFEWSTSMDERVRSSHQAVNGQIFTYKKGAVVDGVAKTLPGEPIQCRCIALPIFDV